MPDPSTGHGAFLWLAFFVFILWGAAHLLARCC